MVLVKNLGEKKSTKKLLEEKNETIDNLKKQLKIPVTNHLQTEEILVIQKEKDILQQDVLDLKSKVLHFEKKIEQLQ